MAVYTPLTEAELKAFCRFFGLGQLATFDGIAAGTINTIYRLVTESGEYALRVLEDRDPAEADFECRLLARLKGRGLAVPPAIAAPNGEFVALHGPRQPVVVSGWCGGRSPAPNEVSLEQCRSVGEFLGKMHRNLAGWKAPDNPFAPKRMVEQWNRCQQAVTQRPSDFTPDATADLRSIGEGLAHGWSEDLEQVVTHQDLFRDNALFVGDRLEAVIDFEMAAAGPRSLDVAVVWFDWAWNGTRFDAGRAQAILQAYESELPLPDVERVALPELLKFVTARFSVTRFWDFEVHRQPGVDRLIKDYRDAWVRIASVEETRQAL